MLYNLIRDSNVQPRWNDIALPHGKCEPTDQQCPALPLAQGTLTWPSPARRPRLAFHRLHLELIARGPTKDVANTLSTGRSLRSCQMAYNDLAAQYSATDYRRPPLPAPIVYPGPDMPKKRPHQPESSTPIGRLLQPRPPHAYSGEFISGPAYPAMSPVGEPANKKKRGRPTKAEAQQRAQEAAARGEVYPPPRKARQSLTASEASQGDTHLHAQTPPGSVPPASTGAITPQHTQPEQSQESSSGKKKRAKPTPLELEKPQRAPSETESPLAFGSAVGDPNRSSQAYSSFTPISAPLPSSTEQRDRDVRMEGVEESQPRTTTPHSFKDTVGI